jgi:beta-glucosidase
MRILASLARGVWNARIRGFWESLLICFFLDGCISGPRGPNYNPADQKPESVNTGGHFWWGVGESNFQNEDPDVLPGTSGYFRTDWDLFADRGRVPPKGNGTYSWSDYDKDIAAMRQIGVTHARIGIEWARIEPRAGVWNEEAIEHYISMIRKLEAAHIEPVVTLWHFTMPDWLVDQSSPSRTRWLNPAFEENWEAYVDRITKALAPYVTIFVPQNEPNGDVNLGWIAGQWPPGVWLDFKDRNRATRVSIKSFRAASDIIRRNVPGAKVIAIESLNYFQHFFPYDPTDALYHATQRADLDHLDGVADKCDLIGMNYYYTELASPITALTIGQRSGPGITMLGWKIEPVGLRREVNLVWSRYRKPIVVTENGIATTHDLRRIKYMLDHLVELDRAREQDHCDVRGYFAWTLADNYEWQYGYNGPFGLSKLNVDRQQFILRPSAMFYKGMIQAQEYADQLHPGDVMPNTVSRVKETW